MQDWTERLAQAQAEAQLIAAAQALGRGLLLSPEYYALNPSDTTRFVYDLYWGYLQRAPDAGGWSGWVGAMQSREHGVAPFADSVEFKEKVARLCGTAPGCSGGS